MDLIEAVRRTLSLVLELNFTMFTSFYDGQVSKSETKGGVMRLIVGGGRAAEMPNSKGAVVLGVRTLSEGGRVGNFSREQVHNQQ